MEEDPKFFLLNCHRRGSKIFQLNALKLFGSFKHHSTPHRRLMKFCQHKWMHNQYFFAIIVIEIVYFWAWKASDGQVILLAMDIRQHNWKQSLESRNPGTRWFYPHTNTAGCYARNQNILNSERTSIIAKRECPGFLMYCIKNYIHKMPDSDVK